MPVTFIRRPAGGRSGSIVSETLRPARGCASRPPELYCARDANRTAARRRRWLSSDRDFPWARRRAALTARGSKLVLSRLVVFYPPITRPDGGPADQPGPLAQEAPERDRGRHPVIPRQASESGRFPKPSTAAADSD